MVSDCGGSSFVRSFVRLEAGCAADRGVVFVSDCLSVCPRCVKERSAPASLLFAAAPVAWPVDIARWAV